MLPKNSGDFTFAGMKDLLKFIFLALFVCTFAADAFSQSSNASSQYPQGYFRDPLDIPIQLVSNFGELRSNHFHMGLDIRTQGRENLPVHAAAEGYVSRIKIDKSGYGNAIYIDHPNGYTTLYAHLNTFFPALAAYIKKKQYSEQQWEQDLALPAGLFPVKKGQFIALSGNTGGSAGPHLHFEIRDTKSGNNLNPLLFGMPVADTKPPVLRGLYWYDRRYSTYATTAKPIPFTRKGNLYTVTAPVVKINSPLVSFAINTEDLGNSSGFNMGIYTASIFLDDSLMNAFRLDNFSYTDTRYVNACIDYSKYMKEKRYVQYLAILPGNKLDIFTRTPTNGLIILRDTADHVVRIVIRDSYGNTTSVKFRIRLSEVSRRQPYIGNVQPLLPNQENTVTGNSVKAVFSPNAFYDVVPFHLTENHNTGKNSASELVGLDQYTVPVHDAYTVQLKTTLPTGDALRDKVVMELKSGRSTEFDKSPWTGDWMTGHFNRLGNVELLIDTLAPLIHPVGWRNGSVITAARTLMLKCTDNLALQSFRAELDGQWLLFEQRKGGYIYTFDEHCPRGKHKLVVTVTDLAGNTTTASYSFTR